MSISPCPVGQELAKAETEARHKASAAFKGNINSMVGLGYSQAATDYARIYELHVRLDQCSRCGGAYSEAFTKEMAADRKTVAAGA
jgi:hypothetical protein